VGVWGFRGLLRGISKGGNISRGQEEKNVNGGRLMVMLTVKWTEQSYNSLNW